MDCPICNSTDVSTLIEIDKLPVQVSDLLQTPAEARSAATGRISLAYCHRCAFIYNRSFELGKVSFEPGYEASLAHTETFRDYVENLVRRLIEDYQLYGKSVLEIGCGDGYLLKQLCSHGGNHGTGIDPTIKKERTECAGRGRVTFMSDYFSDKYGHLIADFICSMSVFETMPDPRGFLIDLRRMIDAKDHAVVYFEVPNASYMFENRATWSIYYEQFGHYTTNTLANLFQRCGYQVLKSDSCYEGGQYIFVEAVSDKDKATQVKPDASLRHDLPEALRTFSDSHGAQVRHWQHELKRLETAGKKIMAWGSGGKGSSFLNLLETEKTIPYVIDINPERQGRFVPGSAQEVVAPKFAREYRPDVIIITNPIYEQEIRKQVSDLGVISDFMSI